MNTPTPWQNFRRRLMSWLYFAATASLTAQVAGTGVIEGRVSQHGSGEFVELARISIEGLPNETFTDAAGEYRLANVPPGTVKLKVFRTGTVAQVVEVRLASGQTVKQDFTLASVGARGDPEGAVKLETFVVATTKEMDGAAIAINTQRFAANAMNVVAADEFGPVATGNVAEVLKSVPGINVSLSSNGEPFTVSLSGVPANNVPISVGGFSLASSSSGTSRRVGMELISVANVSRIEVAYTPTPETTGSALAGSINMVPRSAFERSRPTYTFSVGLLMRDNARDFRKTPGPLDESTRKVHPEFSFSAVVPLNDRFGFTLSGHNSSVYMLNDFMQTVWRGASSATNGGTLPDTTPDQPYLTDYLVRDGTGDSKRFTVGATLDYKLSKHDRISVSLQRGKNSAFSNNRTLTYLVNRVAAGNFSPTFTRGFAGAGEIRLTTDTNKQGGDIYMPTITYRHDGPVWRVESGASLSRAGRYNKNMGEGYFNNTQSRRLGVTVAFEDISYLRPRLITVSDDRGSPLDPNRLENYTLNTSTFTLRDAVDVNRTAFTNARREFLIGGIPLSVKAGVDVRQARKDIREENPLYTFAGRDGQPGTTDDRATLVLDEHISQRNLPFGFGPVQWTSNQELLGVFQSNPGYFTISDLRSYTTAVANSKHAEETIAAAYGRGDLQLLEGRLKIVGGLRVEQTNVEGQGQLIDPTRNFQRGPSGNFILGANGRPLPITADALAAAKLTNIDRGLHSKKEYLRYFPSVNAGFNIRPDLIARAGHYWSVGRPDFGQYAGNLTLPDTANPPSLSNRITVNNAGIKAWSARSTKISLEYYFEGVGLIAVSAFRRDIENFFGTTVFRPSSEFLGLYSLDPVYADYEVSTQYNLPSTVRMTGVEINYKQALTFLPSWARGVQVFANGTAQRATGEASDNFAGYVPRTANWGVSLSRPKYGLRVNWNYTGRQRRGIVAAGRSIEPGTYNWGSKRLLVDVSADYYFYKRFGLFANLSNILDEAVDIEIAGPSTPSHAQLRQRQEFGALWTFGVKGSF